MRIEWIVGGVVHGVPKPCKDGRYRCFYEGTNMNPEMPSTLEDVAKFLRANPRGGVRMTPDNSNRRKHLYRWKPTLVHNS
jgi:hypothetical protein